MNPWRILALAAVLALVSGCGDDPPAGAREPSKPRTMRDASTSTRADGGEDASNDTGTPGEDAATSTAADANETADGASDAATNEDAMSDGASIPDAPGDAGAEGDAGIRQDGAADASPVADAGFDPSRLDTDCDGLSDAEEIQIGTNPGGEDTDGDGIADGRELGRTMPIPGTGCLIPPDADPATTTNPLRGDTDGDGVPDGAEDLNRDGRRQLTELDPGVADTDLDGLPDGIEDRNHDGRRGTGETDGLDEDTDGDGILDGTEDLDHDGARGPAESDPLWIDTDLDGLFDGIEDANWNGIHDAIETSAALFDTDSDGLGDGCEDRSLDGVRQVDEPDPRLPDTDFDGLDDRAEDVNLSCGHDPGETDPTSSDTDCDGVSDFYEIATSYAGGGRTDPLQRDSDLDLLADGLEIGRTSTVPFSRCSSVAPDLDTLSRTNPIAADTDGDQRSDGCEDVDHNGRVDPGELNPLATDTDGDGIADAVEDANGNCTLDPGESGGALADTDGDRIGDAIEAALGTDPLLRDTDGDGLDDGVEDANQNGIIEANETNPRLADTDSDGLNDGVEDANRNGTVDPGETDPRNADTDTDGMADGAEILAGTNPLVRDTDGDGLLEGVEVLLGTNPLAVDTDGDTLGDGDEVIAGTDPLDPNDPPPDTGHGINTVCSQANLRAVTFSDGPGGDWQVAIETSNSYTPLAVAGGVDSAASIDDPVLEIAGFVASVAPLAGGTNPTAEAQALISRLMAGAGSFGATSVNVANNGRQISSHDGFGAVVDVRIEIGSGATDASTLRDAVVAVLAARPLSDFSGFTGPYSGTAAQHVLRFEVLLRPGGAGPRLVLMGALVSRASFDDTALPHHFRVEDLSNGTSLARAYATNGASCDPLTATRTSRADFIWMADISGSTNNDRQRIAAASALVFDGLAINGVDFRMGVVPDSENHHNTASRPTFGQLRSGFTRNRQTFINDLNNIAGATGCEWGLTAADDAILLALPRSAAGTELPTKLRSDAQLVVFYISDEHAQEIEQSTCVPAVTGTNQTEGRRTVPNATQQTTIQGIVQPFIDRIRGEGGIAFGQITPLQAPFCTGDSEDGRGYFEAITQLGGTFYRTCDNNPGAVLQDMINAVSAAASQFVLADTPISMTIQVGITRAGTAVTNLIPRSSTSGFDYDPAANTIYFRGPAYQPGIGDRVTISYRVFQPPRPPVVCPPPLVLNSVTNTCECPADCGVSGGCGVAFLCNRDPSVCTCECTPDCGGTCRAPFACDPPSCSCNCAPNCGGACTGHETCDPSTCACQCPADCGGACTGLQVCRTNTCTCECPSNCGGACQPGERCDLATCSCVGAPN